MIRNILDKTEAWLEGLNAVKDFKLKLHFYPNAEHGKLCQQMCFYHGK